MKSDAPTAAQDSLGNGVRECARVAHSQHTARMVARPPRRVRAHARRRVPRRRRTGALDALQQRVEHAALLRPLQSLAQLGLFHPS